MGREVVGRTNRIAVERYKTVWYWRGGKVREENSRLSRSSIPNAGDVVMCVFTNQ